MRNFILVASILLSAIAGNAQSFLGVIIGTDFAQVKESDYYPNLKVKENGYSSASISFGLGAEHKLNKSFALAVSISYTQKSIKADYLGILDFAHLTEIEFNYFRNSIVGKWYPTEKWHIGAGILLNYRSNVKDHYIENGYNFETPSNFIQDNKKEYGGLLSTGIRYNNFLLDLYFNKSFTPARKDGNDFKPINSFGISLSYLIRVSKSKRR